MGGQQNLEAITGLTIYGGNTKGDAMEAIAAVESEGFELTDKRAADTGRSLVHAHHSQTGVPTEEAKSNNMQVTLLTMHGQDRLTTVVAFTDLAKETIDPYHRTNNK